MTVYRKLQAARHELVNSGIKKTGHNTYGNWKYYQLEDFIPTVNKIFDAVGLCGVVTFGEMAMLTVYDTDDGSSVQFFSPIVYAENNKGQAIQVLGSTHTYLRRYLWLLAMEITENDHIDSEKQEEKPVTIQKPVAKSTAKPPAVIEGKSDGSKDDGAWFMRINAEDGCTMDKWIAIVEDAAEMALGQAASKRDVTAIFTTNRTIFERMEKEAPDAYKSLMSKFGAAKQSFKE
jgi:hypothetical protein